MNTTPNLGPLERTDYGDGTCSWSRPDDGVIRDLGQMSAWIDERGTLVVELRGVHGEVFHRGEWTKYQPTNRFTLNLPGYVGRSRANEWGS